MKLLKEKTTIVAILGALVMIGLLVALILGKIEAGSFAIALSSVGSFMGVLIGIYAGDRKKTETETETENQIN